MRLQIELILALLANGFEIGTQSSFSEGKSRSISLADLSVNIG